MLSITDVINDRHFMASININCPETPVLNLLHKAVEQTIQAQKTIDELHGYGVCLNYDAYSSASENIEKTLVALRKTIECYKIKNEAELIKAVVEEYYSRKLQEHNASSN